MNRTVLDASAILAFLRRESGFEAVQEAMPSAVASAVNMAEVASKLVEKGDSNELVARKLEDMSVATIAFDREQALLCGLLRRITAEKGLSLGDRACIALAIREGAPVMTADRAWATLDLGVEVVLIR